jgi:hypothetical protein
VQTDRTIPNNKPEIAIRDNENGTCMLIDVTISGYRNVIQKEVEEVLKYTAITYLLDYKDLKTEIQRM